MLVVQVWEPQPYILYLIVPHACSVEALFTFQPVRAEAVLLLWVPTDENGGLGVCRSG